MFREVLYSLIGHGIVFGGLVFPSYFVMKPNTNMTVVAVNTVSTQDIRQLIEKSSPQGTPKPRIPQVQVNTDRPLPKENWRPKQTVKSPEPAKTNTAAETKAKSGTSPVQGIKTDQEFEYPDYLLNIRNKIEQNWRPPTMRAAISTRVFFRLSRDGTISRSFVEIKTGNMSFDMSAMNAVITSAPFDPLPDDYPGQDLGIHMDFIYEM